MGFDMALCVLKAGGEVAREGWQERLSFDGEWIWVTPIAGARQLWKPNQGDILAADWVVRVRNLESGRAGNGRRA